MTAVTLRPYQQDAVEGVRDAFRQGHRAPLLVAPTGAGKCLAAGTPVLMSDGNVRSVEEIQVGDFLMGPDSKPRRVVSLSRGREEMFRVTPMRGDSYVVNRSHILSLKMTGGSMKSCGIPDGTIMNISVDDYLTRTRTFRHCAKGWRTHVDFPDHDEPMMIDPYILGAWLGDGSSRGPSITTGDSEIKAEVRSYADSLGLMVREEYNSKNSVIMHVVTGEIRGKGRGIRTNPFTLALHNYRLLRNKHIPHRYLRARSESF